MLSGSVRSINLKPVTVWSTDILKVDVSMSWMWFLLRKSIWLELYSLLAFYGTIVDCRLSTA